MSNSIDIKYRSDTSQSVIATDKLLARIGKLESQLGAAASKSSKHGTALGKSYADAEARVKHFEKALKSATSVTTKYRALEGLQAAVRAFKVAKADFEDSMKVGHDPGQAIDQVAQATSKLSAVQANAWNSEQSRLRESAALRQDIISRMTAQVALEKQLTQDKAIASTKELATVQANAWNTEQSRLRSSAALRQDIISRLTAQVALERQLQQQTAMQEHIAGSGVRFGPGSRHTDPQFTKPEDIRDEKNKVLRDDITARINADTEQRRARARELDRKYASRYIDMEHEAGSRRGQNVFDSQASLSDRKSVLEGRMKTASPDSLSYKNMLAELVQVEAALKRIADLKKKGMSASKPMAAVELGSAKALTQQIKYLKAEMQKVGQGAEWDKMNAQLAKAETQLDGMVKKSSDAKKALSDAATSPIGSWKRLDYELEQAKEDLSKLTYGTKEFLAQQAKVAALQKEWDKLNAAINRTNKSQKESSTLLDSMAGQAAGMATSYLGLQAIVGKITAEWQHQRDLIIDIADKATSIDRMGHKQAVNLGADDLKNATKWARDNQRSVMATQEGMLEVYGYSRSSGANDAKAKQDTLDAMRLSLGDAEMAKERVLGGQAAQRMAEGSSYKAATGVMMSAASATQGTDEIEFIVNSMRKLSTLTTGTRNLDPLKLENALELVTTLTRVNTDVTAETASGDMERMYMRMSDFAPVRSKKGKDGRENKVSQAVIDEFMGTRDFAKRMEIAQRPGNEGLNNQFIDSARAGSPRTSFDKVLNSDRWKKEYAISQDRVIPIEQGEAYFEKTAAAVRDAFPSLVAENQSKSNYQWSQTDPVEIPMANYRRSWDALWRDGPNTKAPDYTGNDTIARVEAYIQRVGREGDAVRAGMTTDQAEVYASIETAKAMADVERKVGNDKTALAVEAQIQVMQGVLDQLKELNAQVAAGKNAPAPAPRAVAPAAKAPPVPRRPAMDLNAKGGDIFGMMKR